MNKTKAVILLSGGIDSSTTLAIAKAEGHSLYAISLDYNQRHRIEVEYAKKVAESLGVNNHLVISFDLREVGGSALLDDREMEGPGDAGTWSPGDAGNSPVNQSARSRIPATYVPARNTIFLSFALGWAEVLNAENIYIGANAVDYSGYPDCRPEYLRAFEDTANLATKAAVEGKMRFKINAPLLYMTKSGIIRRGMELGLDYSLTWSCYDPQEVSRREETERRGAGNSEIREGADFAAASPLHRFTSSKFVPCRKCDSCLFRAKGFAETGIVDPLL